MEVGSLEATRPLSKMGAGGIRVIRRVLDIVEFHGRRRRQSDRNVTAQSNPGPSIPYFSLPILPGGSR